MLLQIAATTFVLGFTALAILGHVMLLSAILRTRRDRSPRVPPALSGRKASA